MPDDSTTAAPAPANTPSAANGNGVSQDAGKTSQERQPVRTTAELMQRHYSDRAVEQSKAEAAQLAEKYPLSWPDGFTPPPNLTFNESDTRVPMARAVAAELGLDRKAFSRLLQLDAEIQAADVKQIESEFQAEQKKLGPNYETRRTALESSIKAALRGDEKAKAAKYEAAIPFLFTASSFELMEDLVNAASKARTTPAAPKPAAERIWPNGFKRTGS